MWEMIKYATATLVTLVQFLHELPKAATVAELRRYSRASAELRYRS
jgi:hypothetical protein